MVVVRLVVSCGSVATPIATALRAGGPCTVVQRWAKGGPPMVVQGA